MPEPRTISPWRKARIIALIVLGFAAFAGIPMTIIPIAAKHSPEYDFTPEEVECSKQRAQVTFAALRDYKARHGGYPDSLEALARDRAEPLPHCCIHDRAFFYYVTSDKADYRLGFSATDAHHPAWLWQVSAGSWYYDDGVTPN